MPSSQTIPDQSGTALVTAGTCRSGLMSSAQSGSLKVGPRTVSPKVATTPPHPISRRLGLAPTAASASATSTQTAGMVATDWAMMSPAAMAGSLRWATIPRAVPASSIPPAGARNATTALEARYVARRRDPARSGSTR